MSSVTGGFVFGFGIILIPLTIFAIVGLFILQWYLSKKEDKRLGWILPFLSLLISLFPLLNIYVSPQDRFLLYLGTILLYFSLFNIPTAVFLIIRYLANGKQKPNKEITKMNILDLE